MSTAGRLRGVFCPLMVPLLPDRAINEPELRRLVDWLIDRGLHGLFANGSCGEFPLFAPAERQRIAQIVIDQTAGRVPVMVGATEATADLTLAAIDHYAAAGADCVVVVPPSYYQLDGPSVGAYYHYLAARASLEVVLYNIPQFANEIPLDVVLELAREPRVIGLKDSSAQLPRFLRTLAGLRTSRPDFAVMMGCDDLLAPGLIMGACGGTLSISGVIPEVLAELYDAFVAGDQQRAIELQFAILPIIGYASGTAAFPDGMRAAMTTRGFDMGPSRTPRAAAHESAIARTVDLVRAELTVLGASGNKA